MYAERRPYPSRPYGDAVNAVAELDAEALIQRMGKAARKAAAVLARTPTAVKAEALRAAARAIRAGEARSEEHTSELQSLMRISYAVFCLNKKTKDKTPNHHKYTKNHKTNSTYTKILTLIVYTR